MVLVAFYSLPHRLWNWKTLRLKMELFSVIPSSCFSMRAGCLRSSTLLHTTSSHFYWDLTISAGMWTSLLALPLCLSFVPYRGNWEVQRVSWIEEVRTGMLHSSFLSEKKEDEKILPEMNGAIHTFQSCCFKLYICLKPHSSPSCILTQFSTCDFDEYIISHLFEKSSLKVNFF